MSVEIERVIDEISNLLARERAHCRAGEIVELADLAGPKLELLERLEAALGGLDDAGPARGPLERLAAEAAANERLVRAAREGVKAARRKIEAVASLRAGAVAYDRAGEAIVSREDVTGKSVRA